jgi:hypothetical protein
MLLSKSKKHYIGLTWDDAGKKGVIAFQADKSDYRGLLAGLEGITGKKHNWQRRDHHPWQGQVRFNSDRNRS